MEACKQADRQSDKQKARLFISRGYLKRPWEEVGDAAAAKYLNAEVPSVHVVPKEQVARAARGAAHFEKLHQVEELAVDVAAHCRTQRAQGSW